MAVVVGLLPFILMHVLRAAVTPRLALGAGAVLAAATVLRQMLDTGPKTLSLVALVLLGCAALASLWRPAFAERGAGLLTSGGLTAFVFAGLLLGRPFTLEWARDGVPAQFWNNPLFLHVNMTISLIWGLGFLVLTVLALPLPGAVRRWHRSTIAVLVMLAAGWFTSWYPGHARQAAGAQNPGSNPGIAAPRP